MTKWKLKFYFFSALFILGSFQLLFARSERNSTSIISELSVVEDKESKFDLQAVTAMHLTPVVVNTPNYGLTKSAFWFRMRITNSAHYDDVLLKIHNGILRTATLYVPSDTGYQAQYAGDSVGYEKKLFNTQYPVFRLKIPFDSSVVCYLRLTSNNVLELPMSAGDDDTIQESINTDQLYFGIYFGIVCVMFLYNIFIYFTVHDRNYLYYVLYIATVGLVQACLKGYASKFLWPNDTLCTYQMTNISLALSGIFSIYFVFNFLNVRKNKPLLFKILIGIQIIYFIGICINLTGNYVAAQQLLQGNASLVSIAIMVAGISTYRDGYKPALYFSISWSFFLTGVIIYILKDAGVLPYNGFTSNSILIGSGLEVALLSFALADKINTYRKEKELSQENELKAVLENERLVREQNVELERKVTERTSELKLANTDLNNALEDLIQKETQLVESEKMASLGQLTAGIAHEINNPINFVTSNVKPLNRDVLILLEMISQIEKIATSGDSIEDKQAQISDYKENVDFDYLKEEIDQLLSGIGEGASRTAEIVKGLRIFSRLDEDDLKKADINEGIDSTLVITNNLMNNTIRVEKKYSGLPLIECYPGKLNQVFLNIISNAVHAVNKKFGEGDGGLISIGTECDADYVYIKISDNGIGMSENTKRRMFEPFFTTKEVGQGTGLGMSIAYNTIIKHNGSINIVSELNKGSEFIIKLPILQK
jgi:two-component system, NtrC family, sensor kinase